MRNPELAKLRHLARAHGWRLLPGSRDGLYNLHDADGHLQADDVTEQEVRKLCTGMVGLGQLRQPTR